MTAATEPLGVSQEFPRPPMETLFKNRNFVSGIAKLFKDPAEKWMDTNSHTDIVKAGSNVQIIIITISQYPKDYTAQKLQSKKIKTNQQNWRITRQSWI